MKTNKQAITFLASRLNVSLEQLVCGYMTNDNVKSVIDKYLDDINSRRVPNGLEKAEITIDLIEDLVEPK
jgi:hypothetical protein